LVVKGKKIWGTSVEIAGKNPAKPAFRQRVNMHVGLTSIVIFRRLWFRVILRAQGNIQSLQATFINTDSRGAMSTHRWHKQRKILQKRRQGSARLQKDIVKGLTILDRLRHCQKRSTSVANALVVDVPSSAS
jgi:hypothetical protein